MEHDKLVFFLFTYFLIFLPFLAFSQRDTYQFPPRFNCLANEGNFTANSTFSTNLNRLVSSLSSLSPTPYGFYNLSSGDSTQETAYATALCRRDVKRDACLTCVQTAARNLTGTCPQSKQAIVFYTHCMFRYSNTTLYGIKVTAPTLSFVSGTNVSTNKGEFDRLQLELIDRLRVTAAAGGLNRKYAQGNGSSAGDYTRFFGSVQCTPDLSEQDCNNCLIFGFENIRHCCDGRDSLRWFCPSCNFRVGVFRFYEFESDLEPDPPAVKPSDSPTSSDVKGKSGSKVIITIVIPIVLVIVFAICVCLVLKWRRKKSGDRIKKDPSFSRSIC